MSRIMFEGRGVRRTLLSMVVVMLAVMGGVASSLGLGQEPTRDELIVAGRGVGDAFAACSTGHFAGRLRRIAIGSAAAGDP